MTEPTRQAIDALEGAYDCEAGIGKCEDCGASVRRAILLLRAADAGEGWQLIPLDDDVRYILGQMPWMSRAYAQMLRDNGQKIPNKCEEEQAAAMHWMLNLYLQFGPEKWRPEAGKIIEQHLEAKKAVLPAPPASGAKGGTPCL